MTAVRRLITIFVLSLLATALFGQETPAAGTRSSRTAEPVVAETDQDANDPNALKLSLEDAIHMSMERNLGVQLQSYSYQASGYSLRSSYGIYDALATALIQKTSQQRAVSSTIESSAGKSDTFDVGVQQNLPTGGAYSFGIDNSRSTSSGGGADIFSTRYSPGVNFAVNQPLLRDFGIDIFRRGITIARNNLGINHEAFRTQLMNTAVSVEQAYLNLAYARRAVDVVKESLFLARDQSRITQIRIDVGAAAPLEILEPRVTIATSEEQLIIATANVRSAEDTLRQLLNLDPAEWNRPIIPTDPVEYAPVTIDVEDAVRRSMDLRPELRQDALTTDTRRVEYLYSRNQVLPAVDFNLNYGLAGLAGNAAELDPNTGIPTGNIQRIPYGRGLRQIFQGDFPSWSIGFNVSVPITNIGARANAKRAEIEYHQSQLQQVQTRQTIMVDVRSAARAVDTAARSIVATKAARDAAEQNVEAERRRYENGMTTNFQVLTIQQRLSDARIRELNALIGYNQAVAQYHRAVGDVLEVRGITVNVPDLPQEPHIFSSLDHYNWLNYSSRVKLEEEPK
jgi:outer membrane protein